jgi:hypothetical protein
MPLAAERSDTAVASPWSTIMSDIHRRTTLLVTAVDELFGTHRVVLGQYIRHYNGRRPHRARSLRPPQPTHQWQISAINASSVDRFCMVWLGLACQRI